MTKGLHKILLDVLMYSGTATDDDSVLGSYGSTMGKVKADGRAHGIRTDVRKHPRTSRDTVERGEEKNSHSKISTTV